MLCASPIHPMRLTPISALAAGFVLILAGASSAANLMLRYDAPASCWEEALPLGNGRLGAMVHGGIEREHLQLNENTLTAGEPPAGMRSIRTQGDRDVGRKR